MKRSVWKYLLKAGISIGLVVLLYRRVDPGALLAEFADLRVLPMVAFFGVLFFNTLISAFKWKVLLAADGIVLPLPRLLASYLIATFFNIFLPSNIGGDAYRVVDIARRTAKPVNTFASVFADRLSGFLALAVLGILFPLIGWTHVYDRRLLLPPLFVFGGLIGVLWILLHERGARWLLEMEWIARRPRMRDIGKRFLISVSSYRRKGPVVCKIMFISFVFQLSVIVAVSLLGVALDLRIPLFAFCIFVPLVSLLEALPVSIYGIGLRDTGYVFFLTQIGRTTHDAAALSLLYVGATLLYALSGGVVFIVKRDDLAVREKEAESQ